MSKNTIKVDQFLINKLRPEIDALNLSLVSMEEYGYSNKPIRDTRLKLSELVTIYDFLKEYAYGSEEVDDYIINKLLSLAGASSMNAKSDQLLVPTVRGDAGVNESRNGYKSIRVYLDNKILLSNTLTMSETPKSFNIYAPDYATKIEVIVKIAGFADTTYTGETNVLIPNIILNDAGGIEFEIKVYKFNKIIIENTIVYTILYNSCDTLSFFYGATPERFSISDLILNESTELDNYNPNQGSVSPAVTLNYDWFRNDFTEGTEKVFRINTTQTLTVPDGSAHALILVPIDLEIVDIAELVVGTPVMLVRGTHYYDFQLRSASQRYNCIYLRDLTNMTFPDRVFQFTIKQI